MFSTDGIVVAQIDGDGAVANSRCGPVQFEYGNATVAAREIEPCGALAIQPFHPRKIGGRFRKIAEDGCDELLAIGVGEKRVGSAFAADRRIRVGANTSPA